MRIDGRKAIGSWVRTVLLFGPLFVGLGLAVALSGATAGHDRGHACAVPQQPSGASPLGC